jgi:hypothetical protein
VDLTRFKGDVKFGFNVGYSVESTCAEIKGGPPCSRYIDSSFAKLMSGPRRVRRSQS